MAVHDGELRRFLGLLGAMREQDPEERERARQRGERQGRSGTSHGVARRTRGRGSRRWRPVCARATRLCLLAEVEDAASAWWAGPATEMGQVSVLGKFLSFLLLSVFVFYFRFSVLI